ncbi:MAG: hypothetical protein ACLR8U_13870 [Oscillospiraceae bacterium]
MNTYLYIAVMALTTSRHPRAPPDAHPKAHQKHVPALVFILRPLCDARRHDLPAILEVTDSPIAGAFAMLVGIVSAWLGLGLLPVSLLCCGTVLALQFLI